MSFSGTTLIANNRLDRTGGSADGHSVKQPGTTFVINGGLSSSSAPPSCGGPLGEEPAAVHSHRIISFRVELLARGIPVTGE